MRKLLCKILYKIGLKNAARHIDPETYYRIFWHDCADALKKSMERASMSIGALADAFKNFSEVSDEGEGKK